MTVKKVDEFQKSVNNHVATISEEIAKVGVWQYLEENDCFQVEYTIDDHFDLIGGRVLIECGGPSTYLDTNGMVMLFWGSTTAAYPLSWDNKIELREYIEERYNDARMYNA